MSRVLFVCSGNTCRSPMAARVAQRVFGPTHTVSSAGAETGTGAPAAKNAIAALEEIGLDLSTHSSVDVQDLDLGSFDLVVIFRPSTAELLSIPDSVPVAYLDVADPYGGTLDDYRAAARSIRRGVRRLYTDDALRRALTRNGPRGSHLEGILNRATKECEGEVVEFVVKELRLPIRETATLGHLKDVIKKFGISLGRSDLLALADALAGVNEVWKKVKHDKKHHKVKHDKKHHKDPGHEDVTAALQQIQSVYKVLDQIE
jgi:protein-tyrosine-phosphatase